jgi:hypothetical protein
VDRPCCAAPLHTSPWGNELTSLQTCWPTGWTSSDAELHETSTTVLP